jgi:hypothetical protein
MNPTDTVTYALDLQPILDVTIQFLSVALMALGGWAIKHFGDRMKLAKDDQIRGYLDVALTNGIRWGADQVAVKSKGWSTIQVRNEVIAHAAGFAIAQVPDALKRFGLDDPATLRRLIEARLPGVAPQLALAPG